MAMGSLACAQMSRKNTRMFNHLKRKYNKNQVVYKITNSKVSSKKRVVPGNPGGRCEAPSCFQTIKQ